ncbi:DnaD domain protein [bacterium]|nr:DnaD domain protein [bacterium]
MNNYDKLAKQIDWKSVLISTYKSLTLSEDEVMVLLVADYCIEQGENLISPELLALKMNLDYKKISEILTQLVNISLIFVEEENGKLCTSLRGIKQLLVAEFLKQGQKDEKSKPDTQHIYSIFENEFGRPLTYTEIETLKSWFELGYGEDKIVLALKEAVAAKVKNFRYIDRILLNWQQQEERRKEGYTTISEDWRKDMEESIKIANLDWVDKHGK